MATQNTLFAIFNASDVNRVRAKMSSVAPWVWNELQEGQWLLVAPNGTTTKEIADKLGFTTSDTNDTAVILRADSYYGRNFATVWDWIQTKQGADLGIATPA